MVISPVKILIEKLRNSLISENNIFWKNGQLSLQFVLCISLITPIYITVGFFGWTLLQKERSVVKQLATQSNIKIGHHVSHDLENYLQSPDLIYQINQDLIKLGLLNFNNLTDTRSLFLQQIKQFNISQINFGSTNGEFLGVKRNNDNSLVIKLMTKSNSEIIMESAIDSEGDITETSKNYEDNYQTESWYEDAVKAGKPVWSQIYNRDDSKELFAISANYPVYNQNNSLIGVLAVELPILEIDKLLQKVNISQSGVIYLIEKSGSIVASSFHETSDSKFEIIDQKLPITKIQETINKLLNKQSSFNKLEQKQQLEWEFQGKQYFVELIPTQNNNDLDWLIVVAVPASEFVAQINGNTKLTILLCLLSITIATYLAILISRWMTKPIYKLLKATQKSNLTEEDLSLKQEIVKFTEIEDLAESFKQINERLKNKFQESDRFFNLSVDLLAIIGTDGYFKQLNSSWSRILGYSIEELLAVPYLEFVHPEDKNITIAETKKISEGATAFNFQNRYRTKDGSYRWLAWNSVPLLTKNLIYAVVRDITDEKQSIEQLFINQRQLIEAEKIVGMGTWENDLTTNEFRCSEQLYCIFGLPFQLKKLTKEDYFKLVYPDDLPTIEKAIDVAINEGQNLKIEQRILCPDATLKHILISGKPIFNEEGKVIKLFGTVLDITERKQTKIALQESEDKFNQIAENIHSIFWIEDPQNNQIIYISPSYEKIWGYSCDELYASPDSFLNTVHPEDRPKVAETLANSLETEEEQEYRIILPDGEIRWILVRGFPIKNQAGEVYKIARIAQDISEYKVVDTKLQLIQERLQLALETSGDGLWDWNIPTGKCYYSSRWLEMLGYEENDLPRNFNTWEMLIHPEDKDWVMDALDLHLEDSSFIFAFDYRLRTKSGGWKWIATYGKVVVRDETGKPVRMICTHTDISARKAAEVTLQQQLELEKLVSSISTSFINLNPNEVDSSLQRALKQVGELTGADGSYLFLVSSDQTQVSNAYQWFATEIETKIDNLQNLPIGDLPWLMDKLYKFEIVHIPVISNLPLEASTEKQILSAQSIQSLLCIPMVSGTELIGFIRFDGIRQLCKWTDSTINLLKIIGEIFVSALEYQEAELALRESEQRFRMMADSAPVLIWMSGNDSLFSYLNQTWLNFTGDSLEEEIGDGWQQAIHPEDLENYLETYQENFYTHQPFTIEYRLRRADGEYRWVFDTGVPRFNLNNSFAGYIGSCIDISDRKQAETQIQNSLQEKEVLLKEIHHRVKNNLHIISNLLDLQSDYIEDEKVLELFADSQNRIQTMALIHEQLYQSKDLGQIDFTEYIHTLMDNLLCSYSNRENIIHPVINVEPISLNLETAIPCGLLINELVTNSLKYAFPNGENGEVGLELHQDEQEKIHLTIRDNGIGIPADFDWQNSSSLGLKLVRILSKQLKAEIEFDGSQGTVVNLKFSPLKYKPRF
ncbi:PAS domain-containing protein [Dapis sp. BLCC M126]|uniref:PAS domain-containing protein n=1 Tax=Dapis sp. BLCC M126 TaxID=3400189 RepID=UPI003CEBCC55